VSTTLFQTSNGISIHFNKSFLRSNILKRFILCKQRQNEFEKAFWVELQEPFQELRSCDKSDYIKDIHAPLKGAQGSRRELFALQEETNDPHELIPNVSLAVLDVKLDLSLLLQSFFFSIR